MTRPSQITTTPARPRRPALTADQRAAAEAVRAAIPAADATLRRQTCWTSVADMIAREAATSYVPSCRLDLSPEQETVAAIFDAAMQALGDPRRAIRWYGRAA